MARWNSFLLLNTFVVLLIGISGCEPESPAPATNEPAEQPSEHAGHDHDEGEHGEVEHGEGASHDHGHWWCAEHGVPEDVCTRCKASLISEFQEKEDWCEKHDRPDSQCFHCHPELEEKFAARYQAKYGKAPPEITDP